MAIKEKKKKPVKTTKTIKREPTPAAILKKVATVSDTNKILQKEIKTMSKIFTENQKVLISMKGMIDTLTTALEGIQTQSKQINLLEDDTQKLYAGLNQVRSQSNLVTRINQQTTKLQDEINKINEFQKTSPKIQDLSQNVEDSMNSIKNNSQMIIKIAQRIDEVRDDLRKVSGKTDSFLEIGEEIDKLRNNIQSVSGKTNQLEANTQIIYSLKEELGNISDKVGSASNLNSELDVIKVTIDAISAKASKIESLGGVVEGLKQQFDAISAKASTANDVSIESIKDLSGKIDKIETEINSLTKRADSTAFVGEGLKSVQEELGNISDKVGSASNLNSELDVIKVTIDAISAKASKIESLGGVVEGLKQQFDAISAKASTANDVSIESIKDLSGKIDKIETEINSLTKRADSTAFVGEGLKSVQENFSSFKQNVYDKTNSIEQKISSVNNILKRQDESTIEFNKKSNKIFEEIQSIKETANKVSDESSKEIMALLKLSEYQSKIRIYSESKYGNTKELEQMASQTTEIINLFDKISIESGANIPLPHEVRQWAVSKILDCADKWEIRFSDVFSILENNIGRDLLSESIRIQQVRDIYGIRAVDEIRKELNIP